jgi:spore coat protein U-like protein
MKTRYLGATVCLLIWHPHTAHAVTCSATSPGTLNFGNVSPVSGNSYPVSGTITVTCTVGVLEGLLTGSHVFACLSISGATTSTPRSLTNGSNSLQYNLYYDSAYTTVWGSAASAPPNPVWVDFNLGLLGILLGGTGSLSVPIYGYLPANQISAPAGTYTQTFSGSTTSLNYTVYTGAQPTCSAAWTSGGNFAFSATATVVNDCNISATNINFGSSGVLGSALTRNGTITAQCTSGDNYSIGLNAGTTPGGTLGNRLMAGPGSGSVRYQLYTGSSFASVWGDGTSGTVTAGGTGTGSNQQYTVYGLVPAQSTPVPGSYNDTVTATITY